MRFSTIRARTGARRSPSPAVSYRRPTWCPGDVMLTQKIALEEAKVFRRPFKRLTDLQVGQTLDVDRGSKAYSQKGRTHCRFFGRQAGVSPRTACSARHLAAMLIQFLRRRRRHLGANIAQAVGRYRCHWCFAFDLFTPDLAARPGKIVGAARRRIERFALGQRARGERIDRSGPRSRAAEQLICGERRRRQRQDWPRQRTRRGLAGHGVDVRRRGLGRQRDRT